jgi:hypothetical protein
MSAGDEASEAPLCPWCGVPWSAAMLAALETHSSGGFCACCAGVPDPYDFAPGPLNLPTKDVCCDSCSKPIYTAPKPDVRTSAGPTTRIVLTSTLEDNDGD